MVSKPETFETGDWRPGTGEAEQETREGQPAASCFSPFAALAAVTPRRVSRFRFPLSGLHRFRSPLPESSRSSRGPRASSAALQRSGFRSPVSGFEWSPVSGFPFLSIRGRVGDRVYKTYGHKIIVTRVPRFDGYEPSAAQRDRRGKMRAATAYAQAVYADPAAKAIYVAAAKPLGRHPFRLAVSEFLQGRTRVTLDAATARQDGEKQTNAPRTPARRTPWVPQTEVPRTNAGIAHGTGNSRLLARLNCMFPAWNIFPPPLRASAVAYSVNRRRAGRGKHKRPPVKRAASCDLTPSKP
jgi:hypothetical protein